MSRRNVQTNNSSCTICDNSNLASICPPCVNFRLNDYYTRMKALKNSRDSRYSKLTDKLESRKKADDQQNWRVAKAEKIKKLRDHLRNLEKQLSHDKSKVKELSSTLKLKYEGLDEARATLEKSKVEFLETFYPNLIHTQGLGLMAITSERLQKQAVIIKQICKLFPMRRVNSDGEGKDGYNGPYDQICYARLPRGLDPHSVPSEELAASLGYIVQLLNLAIPALAAPALHNSGFAGSCSRVWQRDSYWDARPSSQSKEYQLFIPRKNFCSSVGDNSWSAAERSSTSSSSNFGVSSVESEKRHFLLDSDRNGSFSYSSASLHSIESHKDLQKGISFLKKSVACITSYCYNSLGLEVPPEASTFEAFARLLGTLSSSREIRSVISRRTPWSRSDKQGHKMNRSVWNVNSGISSITGLLDSSHTMRNYRENLTNSAASFLYSPEMTQYGKTESSIVEEWDIIEHPKYPPPPSQVEDIEHWTRAMFIDATAKTKK
ncbi:Vacuolar sorting 38 and autophagy-related subunit 14 [Carex littledalei]|uniref:Vacuolar sorting 38 and autophagy-related subunit 14 n=1 Tax=Carex littledalei TaxID=544730 RepID=A0A833QJN9_9POAL|nr:Vacuolar sorting 38 and autophagy-related subunit 14 [Carex littledalei]